MQNDALSQRIGRRTVWMFGFIIVIELESYRLHSMWFEEYQHERVGSIRSVGEHDVDRVIHDVVTRLERQGEIVFLPDSRIVQSVRSVHQDRLNASIREPALSRKRIEPRQSRDEEANAVAGGRAREAVIENGFARGAVERHEIQSNLVLRHFLGERNLAALVHDHRVKIFRIEHVGQCVIRTKTQRTLRV